MLNITPRNISIEGAKVRYRDLSGEPSKFNKTGQRNITIELDMEDALALQELGYNVRFPEVGPDGDERAPLLKIVMSKFSKVYRVNSERQTLRLLGEHEIGDLMSYRFVNVDLTFYGREYEVGKNKGLSANLTKGYFDVEETYFDQKYSGFQTPGRPVEDEDLPW